MCSDFCLFIGKYSLDRYTFVADILKNLIAIENLLQYDLYDRAIQDSLVADKFTFTDWCVYRMLYNFLSPIIYLFRLFEIMERKKVYGSQEI